MTTKKTSHPALTGPGSGPLKMLLAELEFRNLEKAVAELLAYLRGGIGGYDPTIKRCAESIDWAFAQAYGERTAATKKKKTRKKRVI